MFVAILLTLLAFLMIVLYWGMGGVGAFFAVCFLTPIVVGLVSQFRSERHGNHP